MCSSFAIKIKSYLNHVRLIPHLPNLCHVSQLLVDQGTLEHDKHEQGEEGVVPVLVQTPQAHTKHLKSKIFQKHIFLRLAIGLTI